MTSADTLKQQAAAYALQFIESGMVVGLGGGSTAELFIVALGTALQQGILQNIVGIPSAKAVGQFARRQGIPLTDFDRKPHIDVCVDGADEADPHLDVIKGGGGFLTREKIVAQASARLIIVVDESKLSRHLGTLWALPVEVLPFGLETQRQFLLTQGAHKVQLRLTADGDPYHTDQGNLILDADFGPIENPGELAQTLAARAGIVEHGLFLQMATDLVAAHASRGVVHQTR